MIDPDVQNQTNDMNYGWSCENAIDGSPCILLDGNNNSIMLPMTLNQTIPANTLTPLSSYVFFITVNKVNAVISSQVTASATIKVDSTAQSSISVLYAARLATQAANLNEQLYFIVEKNIITNRRRRILVNS